MAGAAGCYHGMNIKPQQVFLSNLLRDWQNHWVATWVAMFGTNLEGEYKGYDILIYINRYG